MEKHLKKQMPNDELMHQGNELTDEELDQVTGGGDAVKRSLTIKNEEQELLRVNEFIENVGEEVGLNLKTMMKLQLVMEEMVTNVIFYAYPQGTSADITLTAESDGKELTFVLSDSGKPFDPTAREEADIETNPMDREQGGMGILIVKNIMNEVNYQRLGDTKQLTMKKKLKGYDTDHKGKRQNRRQNRNAHRHAQRRPI